MGDYRYFGTCINKQIAEPRLDARVALPCRPYKLSEPHHSIAFAAFALTSTVVTL